MASNVADTWQFFPSVGESVTAPADVGVTVGLATGIVGGFLAPSRFQVKQFGVILAASFANVTTFPVIQLQKLSGTTFGTVTTLGILTVGPSAETYKTSFNRDVVGAGGPGTIVISPTLSPGTLAVAADFVGGAMLVGPDTKSPSAMINPGEFLRVSVSTQGAGATPTGAYVAFARLEVAGEQAMERVNVMQMMKEL